MITPSDKNKKWNKKYPPPRKKDQKAKIKKEKAPQTKTKTNISAKEFDTLDKDQEIEIVRSWDLDTPTIPAIGAFGND